MAEPGMEKGNGSGPPQQKDPREARESRGRQGFWFWAGAILLPLAFLGGALWLLYSNPTQTSIVIAALLFLAGIGSITYFASRRRRRGKVPGQF
ncbi:hypothetical protein IV498_18150 [Paenarthrobacter sp. Z7-10]|uniref:hypothetical protein n=1 Tax=Paenarthrobacter sp. Z7-10 TaxID=2787635 RepID=UPI0022A92D3A|nr:hypothetical protein [Paenarthrobacter sp. Z7-10]MCZ2405027.1 hypothetical protein [Paenarthrobacter sp. Z7-10]